MHGSAGQLFFWGIVVGAVAMLGLFLLLAGLRSDIRRRGTTRRISARVKNGEHEALTDDTTVKAGRVPAESETPRAREEEGAPGGTEGGAAE